MPIRRLFLDWTLPALPATADFLLREFGTASSADLQRVLVTVPSAWAKQRLLEILVDRAERDGLPLTPPRLLTISELPEELYTAKYPFADDLTQHLAWIEALRQTPAEELVRIIRQPPASDDLFAWLALGDMLAHLHWEMAGDGLGFAEVVKLLKQMDAPQESGRWQVLEAIQQRYLAHLDGLKLWDKQTARLFAIEHNELATDRPIVLVRMVDLNRAQRRILDQVAEHVTVLSVAPQSLAERFDEHGCVIPDAWRELAIERIFERTALVEGPGDQADAVARSLAALGGRYAADEITIGVPDPRVLPYLRQRMEECAVPLREGTGLSLTQTGPGRLLRAVAEYLGSDRFPAFASLIRHPAIEHWLRQKQVAGDWITELDTYYGSRLPTRLVVKRLEAEEGCASVRAAHAELTKLLDGLTGSPRPLKDWSEPILKFLIQIYGTTPLDPAQEPQRIILEACTGIREALHGLDLLHESIAPRVSGADALQLLLRTLDQQGIAPPAIEPAVEVLEWLDLPLDDAPVLILTGFNEGSVPSSRNGDVFLPNQLRQQLGLEDNERRYARDAYFASWLAASRRELTVITGRRTAEHDPLAPSRLLFACPDDQLADRVLTLFSPPVEQRGVLTGSLRAGREQHGFQVPPPQRLPQPVTMMRVTEFADYLACPYRYYLRRRLNLQGPETQAEELPANLFGELLHEILQRFGESSEANSLIDPARITEFLDSTLNSLTAGFYGEHPLPAVLVQFEQIRHRLHAFARWQAQWAAQGWRIEYAEQHFKDKGSQLLVDGTPMILRGRIDRIDVREASRGVERVVFDYKTGDKGADPEKKHRTSDGEWTDLQLPLYRHLVRSIGLTEPVGLGYILLPKDISKTGDKQVAWTDDDLSDADRVAEDVVRGVRAERFWPPTPDLAYFEEFSAICQDGLYGNLPTDDEEEPG